VGVSDDTSGVSTFMLICGMCISHGYRRMVPRKNTNAEMVRRLNNGG